MLQFGTSLTYDTSGVNYDRNMFIIQATALLRLSALWNSQQAKTDRALKQTSREIVGIISFSKRLKDTIPLFSDKWHNENELNINMILKAKILETFLAKCVISLKRLYDCFLYHDFFDKIAIF
jgi:hypothetical protein